MGLSGTWGVKPTVNGKKPVQVLKVKKTQKPKETIEVLKMKKTESPRISGTLTKVMKDSKTGKTTSTSTTPYKQTPISEKEFNK